MRLSLLFYIRFYSGTETHIYEQKDYKSVICAVWLPGRSGMEVIMYQKEIIYLGLYKDGDRLGSAGFLKVEKRDKDGNLSLVVKNVPHSINGKYPVRYYNGSDWKEADGIIVREGEGQWERQEPDTLEQVRLQIILPGGYLVEGASKDATRQTAAVKEEEKRERLSDAETRTEQERPDAVEPEQDLREQAESRGEAVAVSVEPYVSSQKRAVVAEQAEQERSAAAKPVVYAPERHVDAEPPVSLPEQQKIERIVVQRQGGRVSHTAMEQPQKPLMADTLAIEGLKEDKWEQILDTYDNIHPYGDERIYVKLEPKNFIILSGKYQHLVNNSFLLHGFYNYRHVILGKEGEAYYLGVPGVFYEREKMVAVMFGFEAFECESGESKAGEFGYYLRKVEL